MADSVHPDVLGLRVAELGLWIDARGMGQRLVGPPGYATFLEPRSAEPSVRRGDLVLTVRNSELPEPCGERTCLCQTDVWELWSDTCGRYLFRARRQSLSPWVAVAADFNSGELYADLGGGPALYPLQFIDIVLFVNWLATCGDLILHAAGVAMDGRGYAFVGPSGAGKSTLVAALANHPAVTVLGEDQVVLRHLEGQFRIYGTPWHEHESLYSPLGAPLAGLFFLDRDAPQTLVSLSPAGGVAQILQTAFLPYYRPAAVSAILDRLALLSERVPLHTLAYRLGSDVAELLARHAGTLAAGVS